TTIELYQPLGIPDGQEVELTLQTVPAVVEARQWGDGLRRCAGALADMTSRCPTAEIELSSDGTSVCATACGTTAQRHDGRPTLLVGGRIPVASPQAV
ncbi:MAG: hypothetical protein NTY19_28315, partial [Planctomycetota bacterium]|nr:hypothetical protein [Planctomycetota bacterium]